MDGGVITRFAPSPTGYLHLGHAYSALFAYEQAVRAEGRFLLRIEDIDPVRCKPEFTTAVFDDLHWLGLTWEEPVRQQSQHMGDYARALKQLYDMGVLYPCTCTRREVEEEAASAAHAPHLPTTGPDGVVYPGTCRSKRTSRAFGDGAPVNWRLDVAKALSLTGSLDWHDAMKGCVTARPEEFGDVVLARKDVPTSYHLSVTVDDHLQGVTLVTRGEDLFRATDIHRLLQALLGYQTPQYHHHGLMCDEQGKRFSKRDQSVTLRALQSSGKTPGEIRALCLGRAGFK